MNKLVKRNTQPRQSQNSFLHLLWYLSDFIRHIVLEFKAFSNRTAAMVGNIIISYDNLLPLLI